MSSTSPELGGKQAEYDIDSAVIGEEAMLSSKARESQPNEQELQLDTSGERYEDDASSFTSQDLKSAASLRASQGASFAAAEASLPKGEKHPWRALSYVIFIMEFMAITLDLFLNSSDLPGFHYFITTLVVLCSLALSVYQIIRLCTARPGWKTKSAFLLVLSLLMQLGVLGCVAFLYKIENDQGDDAIEYAMFGICIGWGFINPMTYSSIAQQADNSPPKTLSPVAATLTVFTHHFTQTPFLFCCGMFFAIAQAILSTYQGAIINDLTKAVTKRKPDGSLNATDDDVERLSGLLILIWFSASVARVLFDATVAFMFSKLEVLLRARVFEKALELRSSPDTSMTPADFQVRYASDVTGVVSLYATLLRGVVVNMLMIIVSFIFLAVMQWIVAIVSLGFIVVGVSCGPTDLAAEYSNKVQDDVTNGLTILGESMDKADTHDLTSDEQDEYATRHGTEVLLPLKQDLSRRIFFSNMVDTFMFFFSSFLTAVVVITMSWQVYYGTMNSSDFLGLFFIFKQLQKPSLKISAVMKKAASKTANLSRINALLEKEPNNKE